MTPSELRDLIWARITRSGLQADSSLLDRLTIYLQLLARWDSRINLTGFSMNPPTTAAVDRLLVEPLQLVSLVGPPVGLWADLGSGGGSPALPLHLRQPANELWLIESKERKAAFLREAIRELGLSNVRVEVARIESIASDHSLGGRVDLVTVRAVGSTPTLFRSIAALLNSNGKALLVGAKTAELDTIEGLECVQTTHLAAICRRKRRD